MIDLQYETFKRMDAVYKATNRLALAAICLMGLPGLMISASKPARADVVQSFNLNGVFQLQALGLPTFPFAAQVTIDTTIGTVTAESFFPANAPGPITFTQGYNVAAQSYLLQVDDAIAEYQIFFNAASLVNYAGGNLASIGNPTPGGVVSTFTGQLLPPSKLLSGSTSVAVPEPASGGLLAVGAVAMAMLLATRRRSQGGTQRG